jgi:hypothetical protein
VEEPGPCVVETAAVGWRGRDADIGIVDDHHSRIAAAGLLTVLQRLHLAFRRVIALRPFHLAHSFLECTLNLNLVANLQRRRRRFDHRR